ncbi:MULTISPECIES: hypothetical protein [Bartonella]|uniref:Phage related protein n=1 Tax=Bartonella chomelii TaxID=236402 RepID=A0ABR6E2B1_9HYPH|nr:MULTISPECIES: hypothetical protein [Bartonella]MBA9082697.1 hypothetical protein [Bartonella chomelii]
MRSSNGRSDCGEGSSNGEDGEDAAETSGVGENEECTSEGGGGENAVSRDGVGRDSAGRGGVGRGGVGRDDEREDTLREGGGEVIIGKEGEVVGEDKAGVDEANANEGIYPLP